MRETFLLLCCVLLLAPGCSTSKYKDTPRSIDVINPGDKVKVEVLADADQWKNSGVRVVPGKEYEIRAHGHWKIAGTCNATGPDGDTPYNLFCWDIVKRLVEGWTQSALVAKVGSNGTPFAIGDEYRLNPTTEGILYFRINESKFVYDNSGSMEVTIALHPGNASFLAANTDADALTKKKAKLKEEIDRLQKEKDLSKLKAQKERLQSSYTPVTSDQRYSKRTALVIGNSRYAHAPLSNPVNDAKDIASALKAMDFNVTVLINADQRSMESAIQVFGEKAQGGVGLFYFAGHGLQVDGENYLVPVGTNIKTEGDVRYKAVAAGQVLDNLAYAQTTLNVVILDACRNNPLQRSFRSRTSGLAQMVAPKGSVIAYSTAPGDVAVDGSGRNSPYAKAFMEELHHKGLPLEQLFKQVARSVIAETNGQQRPWISSDFVGEFSFAK